ncbi:hypothetical protein M0804_011683 [Polistes exclamans]|nr:hypothetical protein M0804_011683 [Polistes exclamans]
MKEMLRKGWEGRRHALGGGDGDGDGGGDGGSGIGGRVFSTLPGQSVECPEGFAQSKIYTLVGYIYGTHKVAPGVFPDSHRLCGHGYYCAQ